MKTFKEFISDDAERTEGEGPIEESLLRSGSAAVLASRGKTAGDAAARKFRQAQETLRRTGQQNNLEKKVDDLIAAIALIAQGHENTRDQLGSIAATIMINTTKIR